MIVIVNITANSSKRKELLQALSELRSSIELERGCIGATVLSESHDENRIIVTEEWEDEKFASNHFRSENFNVLLGAIRILGKSAAVAVTGNKASAIFEMNGSDNSRKLFSWLESVLGTENWAAARSRI